MSRSSFLLLFFTVAILTAAASLKSGGGRMGNPSASLRYEANADIGALKDDVRGIRGQAAGSPKRLRNLLDDAARNLRTLQADVAADARIAAHRLATLVKVL